MVEHIIFDCDGVLVDSEIIAANLAAEMLAPQGYKLSGMEHAKRFAGQKEKDILRSIREEDGIIIPDDFLENFEHRMREAFRTILQPIEGMVDLIHSLRLPVSVVSNSQAEDVIRNTTKVGIWEKFEGRVFTFEMVPRPKPFPDVYLKAVREIGVPKENVLVVEDSVAGSTSAKDAGLFVIGFLGASHIFEGHKEKLEAIPVDRIAQNAKELVDIFREKGVPV
ncbi:MAG: HAD-IA family hydrolase [Bacteroidota bacterium]